MPIIKFFLFALLTSRSISIAAGDPQAVSGTTGTPLGGVGAGAVKLNANDGSFAAMIRPPADAYDFKSAPDARFECVVQRGERVQTVSPMKAAVIDGHSDDDAVWPLHRVNFGEINGVEVRMTGFSPFDRGDPATTSLPCALYEMRLTNIGAADANVICALRWNTDGHATAMPDKGFTSGCWAVCAASGDPKAAVFSGSDGLSAPDGAFSAPLGDGVNGCAVKVSLGPAETKSIRFVLAWYTEVDPELSHYLALFKEPGAIAAEGMTHFDTLKKNAESLVDRMRASNLPPWLKNQTLNTLVNFTTNAMYKKDGRVAFSEGQWTCFGTMDQMWHARQIVGQIMPFFAWQELRYWARTQRKDGQIHHDFNYMGGGKDRATRSTLVGWDDTEHDDYRNIDKWVDLNCAYVISVFETYQQTGDTAEFTFEWPNMKMAAQRVLDQVKQLGNTDYPYTFDRSENSYDAGGEPNVYNAGLSAIAYKIMVELARERGETEVAATYQKAYDTVTQSFRNRYLKGEIKLGPHCENVLVGPWLSLHLKLGELWTADETDRVLKGLDSFYHPYYWGLGNATGTYDEWTPYVLSHYGGMLINTRRENQWYALQHDAFSRQYDDRNRVFNHPLDILAKVESPKSAAIDVRSKKQYISMPVLWRNYYDLIGYHRDRRSNALWLTPIVLPEMNHRMTDALYLSPEGDGIVTCIETGEKYQNREITFQPDIAIEVRSLHLADHFGNRVAVTVNGKECRFERAGTGYARDLAVDWSGTTPRGGLRVVVTGDPGPEAPRLPAKPSDAPQTMPGQRDPTNAFAELHAARAPKAAGTVIVDGYVASCNNFDYVQFEQVDFGKVGATGFIAKVKGLTQDASIDIVLDSVSGEAIGNCQVPAPTGRPEWTELHCPIKKTTGIHDLFLRFSGSSPDDLMNLDTLKFTKDAANK